MIGLAGIVDKPDHKYRIASVGIKFNASITTYARVASRRASFCLGVRCDMLNGCRLCAGDAPRQYTFFAYVLAMGSDAAHDYSGPGGYLLESSYYH